MRVDPYSNRENRGVTATDGSFAIPIRWQSVDGRALLARFSRGDRAGFFLYDYVLTRAQAGARTRSDRHQAGSRAHCDGRRREQGSCCVNPFN